MSSMSADSLAASQAPAKKATNKKSKAAAEGKDAAATKAPKPKKAANKEPKPPKEPKEKKAPKEKAPKAPKSGEAASRKRKPKTDSSAPATTEGAGSSSADTPAASAPAPQTKKKAGARSRKSSEKKDVEIVSAPEGNLDLEDVSKPAKKQLSTSTSLFVEESVHIPQNAQAYLELHKMLRKAEDDRVAELAKKTPAGQEPPKGRTYAELTAEAKDLLRKYHLASLAEKPEDEKEAAEWAAVQPQKQKLLAAKAELDAKVAEAAVKITQKQLNPATYDPRLGPKHFFLNTYIANFAKKNAALPDGHKDKLPAGRKLVVALEKIYDELDEKRRLEHLKLFIDFKLAQKVKDDEKEKADIEKKKAEILAARAAKAAAKAAKEAAAGAGSGSASA